MTQVATDQWVYLRSYLAPLAGMLARPDVTDLYVNRPGELWIETLRGEIERHEAPLLDSAVLARLARQVAAFSGQGISREHPMLTATLPDGARVQVVAPPATRGNLALAVRKHVAADMSLDDYVADGSFSRASEGRKRLVSANEQIAVLVEREAYGDALRLAVRSRRNVLISGGTSTGKTTFLNALIREVPSDERLIVIEDTPELAIRHENAVGLLAVRGRTGEAEVTADDLVTASLRMRPDRIIVGELRGPEAFAFLRAINTGHPGSMTTIHADSPEGATEQLVLLVLQGGSRLSRADVRDYIRATIDLYVQLDRIAGRRIVSDVRLKEQVVI